MTHPTALLPLRKTAWRYSVPCLAVLAVIFFALGCQEDQHAGIMPAINKPSTEKTALQYFTVETDAVPLPRGATAKARRIKISHDGKLVTALSQGFHRAYLYPVFTPAGVALTTESPIDHPHHQSITIGADHFNVYYPYATDKLEEANYNFYVNETFQGRSSGRIVAIDFTATEVASDHLRIVQQLEWRGAQEWGSPTGGRLLALETRTIDIYTHKTANIFDIRSALRPTEWALSIGPTRHAYFTIRLADGLHESDGGTIVDSKGRHGSDAINGRVSKWVDYSGPAPHGRGAGITVFTHPSLSSPAWHVAEWGTITVNPLAHSARKLDLDDVMEFSLRIVAHDGYIDEVNIEDFYDTFIKQQ